MFKKSDILPLILALVSTVLIVGTGFTWLAKSDIAGFSKSGLNKSKKILKTSDVQANSASSARKTSTTTVDTQRNFVMPVIVPQGTSVAINGSEKFSQINTSLRTGFHDHYPGTVITTNADGSDVGLDLLYSGDIDLLALDRPLNEAETAAGLTAIQINNSGVKDNQKNPALYYVYQEPINPDVEAFLGYALSKEGKEAISSH
jgi:phosphate transport system substrate-binding protein